MRADWTGEISMSSSRPVSYHPTSGGFDLAFVECALRGSHITTMGSRKS